MAANWKSAYTREVNEHKATRKLVEEAVAEALQHQKNMWYAQQLTQATHVKFEEAERQRVAAQAQLDKISETHHRLLSERDLLVALLREGTLRSYVKEK
jgi:predicted  nucleic acid-binding Zn-ribbon protein